MIDGLFLGTAVEAGDDITGYLDGIDPSLAKRWREAIRFKGKWNLYQLHNDYLRQRFYQDTETVCDQKIKYPCKRTQEHFFMTACQVFSGDEVKIIYETSQGPICSKTDPLDQRISSKAS